MATLKKSVVRIKKAQDGYKHPEEAEDRKSEKIAPMKATGQASTTTPKLATKAPEKKQSFGEAFKAARADKKGTFTWNGKSYTTQTKEEAAKKATPAAAKPTTVVAKSATVSKPAPATPAKKAEPTVTVKKETAYVAPKKVDTSTFKAPEKKVEAVSVKKTTSPADSVRAKMKANNDTVMARANRYYGKKYGTFASGGKTKKKCC